MHTQLINGDMVSDNISYLGTVSTDTNILSYNAASGSNIKPCIKVDKPVVVYIITCK